MKEDSYNKYCLSENKSTRVQTHTFYNKIIKALFHDVLNLIFEL